MSNCEKTSEREKSMNPTRIAGWSHVLTVGVISAIAITGTQTRMLAGPRRSLDTMAQSEDEINDKNWQNHPKIVAIRKIVIRPRPESGMARTKLSTEFVMKAGLVDFESLAMQRGPSGGTSIIRRGKIHPGMITTTTTMLVDCDSY